MKRTVVCIGDMHHLPSGREMHVFHLLLRHLRLQIFLDMALLLLWQWIELQVCHLGHHCLLACCCHKQSLLVKELTLHHLVILPSLLLSLIPIIMRLNQLHPALAKVVTVMVAWFCLILSLKFKLRKILLNYHIMVAWQPNLIHRSWLRGLLKGCGKEVSLKRTMT
uniref:Uncharacterized protein n=1 Tax=Rhizophora mucronata TaxID=61149 RepID=A0A2P2MUH0_RHIMU